MSQVLGQKRAHLKRCCSSKIIGRYLPGIVRHCSQMSPPLWFLALIVEEAKSVSTSQACSEMLNASRKAGRHLHYISMAGVGNFSSASCAGTGSWCEAGWFLAFAGHDAKFAQRIWVISLRSIEHCRCKMSKNCGGGPKRSSNALLLIQPFSLHRSLQNHLP